MVKLIKLFLIVSLVVFVGCGKQSGSGDSDSDSDSGVATLLLDSDVESILSDDSDTAILTVQALDRNNAALEGATISVRSTGGVLSSSSVTTESNGTATFTLTSGSITSAEVVTITASSGSTVATETVSVLGTTATFTTDTNSVGLDGASSATLTAYVRNGGGTALEGVDVVLDSDLGYIDGSSGPVTLTTNSSGLVTALFTGGSTAGTATITLSGPDTASLSILISDAQFELTDTQGGSVNISNSDTITLTWIDAAGAPVSGETVSFAATKGSFDTSGNNFIDVVTNASGIASTVFHPTAVGDDTIVVESSVATGSLESSLDLTILAGDPASITVNVNPSVVSLSSGGIIPEATVKATVLDDNNRAVQGVEVAFSITGPGGGEGISPAKSVTNAAGVATAVFTSGGQISSQDGVVITAKVVDDPSVSDSVTMTIANQAATIKIGYTNQILTQSIGSAEDVYAMPFTVLVTDTNGSAISDQQVSLSVYPTYFKTGTYADNDEIDTYTFTGIFANEDDNRNGILDSGEDDTFINGRLDPGGVVSITSSVTTDSNGFAAFNLVYAKAYGRWTDVEITATTTVSGTESTSVLNTTLAIEDGDKPYLNSPYP